MNKTVIGEIYESLSTLEIKQLDGYLSTSNWQYSETIISAHQCLMQAVKEMTLEKLDKKQLFNFVYEEESYNDTKLRYLLNRLLEAIREFQLVSEFRKENIFTKKVWIDFLIERKLRKNIQYHAEEKSPKTNSDYQFLYDYFKSQEINFQLFNFTQDVEKQYDSIIKVMQKAEHFSDLVFLKNYCSLISFRNLYRSLPFQLPIEKFTEIRTKYKDQALPEFEVYFSLIDLLISQEEPAYHHYKETLFSNFDIWGQEEKPNFLYYLLNFTTNQINRGNQKFIGEQYDLFCFFENENYFLLKGYLDPGIIHNVIHIYLRKKDFDRATKFINTYVDYLDVKDQESCRHFNLARIYFEKSIYKDSLLELLKVDFNKDAFYSLNAKLLLLKNYYELKETEAFESLCLSFKEFIRRNKVISDNYKAFYLNFVKRIRILYMSTSSKRKKLISELESSTQLAEKAWLIEKANQSI